MAEQFTGTVEILNSDSGKPTVTLNGGDDERGGELILGGNGFDGELALYDRRGGLRVFLIGDRAEIRFQREDGTISLNLDGQRGEIRIKDWEISAPDYVFANDYELRHLDDLAQFVRTNHHLPDIPSAEKISSEGVNVGQFSMLLLKKIEELYLYVIQQDRMIQQQNARLAMFEQELSDNQ